MFKAFVKNKNNILVVISWPLDFDCVSSGIVIKKYLESQNVKITLLHPIEVTEKEKEIYLNFKYFNEIVFKDPRQLEDKYNDFDGIILLDGRGQYQFFNNELDMDKECVFSNNIPILNIDHHINTQEDLVHHKIGNSSYSSTIEVILRNIVDTKFLDSDMATLSYAGIAGDTGLFKWNMSAETFELLSKLVKRGADYKKVTDIMYYQNDSSYYHNINYVFENLIYDQKTRSMFFIMSHDQILKESLSKDDLKKLDRTFTGVIAKSLKDYDRGFCLIEEEPNLIKVTCRGKELSNKISLANIMTELGQGGGHRNAAGCTYHGSLMEAYSKILKLLSLKLSPVRIINRDMVMSKR